MLYFIIPITLTIFSCKDKEFISPSLYGFEISDSTNLDQPIVGIGEPFSITATSVSCAGVVAFEGLSPVLERGLCYSTNKNPKINNSTISAGKGKGSFVAEINELEVNTTYYVRAFAINDSGIYYSNQKSFTTAGFSVGLKYGGGIVFALDLTGQHGWIAANEDANNGLSWSVGKTGNCDATGNGLGDGLKNTKKIIAFQGSGDYAAKFCDEYISGGYSDWYLPSEWELYRMMTNDKILGITQDFYYWSSTEQLGVPKAYALIYKSDPEFPQIFTRSEEKSFMHKVRPIRSF